MQQPDTPFLFNGYALDRTTGILSLRYAFDGGPDFTEMIRLPVPMRALSAPEETALDSALRLVFLLSGISYYKARVPTDLRCPAFPLAPALADFVQTVYREGLGEFAFRNGLDLSGRIRVQADAQATLDPRRLSLPRCTCVPVGGGKDSIVTIETMKRAGEPLVLFASGTADPIARTIATAGLPAVRIVRTLDPHLMEMNRQGAWNGHVPITAILSAIAVVCAILYGFDTIALSNEHSASEPNLSHNGVSVNHQYSKSLDFERDFAAMVTGMVSPDIAYFSFLRPLTEAAITRRFVRLDAYHDLFRSCNAAFKLDEKKRATHWCCACPKCRFVFLALAPFLPKARLEGIFGANLLADSTQTEGYAELVGKAAHKPFECVGTVQESALLLGHLARLPDWQDAAVVQALAPQVAYDSAAFDSLFARQPDHDVPERFLRMLRDDA